MTVFDPDHVPQHIHWAAHSFRVLCCAHCGASSDPLPHSEQLAVDAMFTFLHQHATCPPLGDAA